VGRTACSPQLLNQRPQALGAGRVSQAAAISSVPMSRLEPDAFVDYDTMGEKLKERKGGEEGAPAFDALSGARRSSASASTSR